MQGRHAAPQLLVCTAECSVSLLDSPVGRPRRRRFHQQDGRVGPPVAQALVEPLSERELEVLRLLAEGLTNREIAEELTVTLGTVKTHVNHIYGKLGVHSRVQAVTRARELGLLG